MGKQEHEQRIRDRRRLGADVRKELTRLEQHEVAISAQRSRGHSVHRSARDEIVSSYCSAPRRRSPCAMREPRSTHVTSEPQSHVDGCAKLAASGYISPTGVTAAKSGAN